VVDLLVKWSIDIGDDAVLLLRLELESGQVVTLAVDAEDCVGAPQGSWRSLTDALLIAAVRAIAKAQEKRAAVVV